MCDDNAELQYDTALHIQVIDELKETAARQKDLIEDLHQQAAHENTRIETLQDLLRGKQDDMEQQDQTVLSLKAQVAALGAKNAALVNVMTSVQNHFHDMATGANALINTMADVKDLMFPQN
jgi:phage I-like protein